MKRFWKRYRNKILVFLAYPYLMALMGSSKVRHHHRERLTDVQTGSILCGLHARGVVSGYIWRRLGYWVLVSLSRDGEMQNMLFTRLGYRTVRGSTGRGGVKATIEAIRLLRTGKETLVIAIDGPRGPRGIVQEGALLMARKSGAALVPVGISCNPRRTVDTWDNYMVPKPFCKCEVVYGEPIYIPENADEETTERIRRQLQEAIHACEAEANQLCGYSPFEGQDLDPSAAT